MYVGLKQPRGDGERYVTPARAAAKETSKLGASALNKKCYIIKKKWISKSPKYFQSSWKMTYNSVSFKRRRFPSIETIFIHKSEKMCSRRLFKIFCMCQN